MRRPQDWLRQAELDLATARDNQRAGHHEWACFAAQQAAEKAVKAFHESMGTEAWGHSVVELLRGLKDVPGDVMDSGKALDKHYIRPLSEHSSSRRAWRRNGPSMMPRG